MMEWSSGCGCDRIESWVHVVVLGCKRGCERSMEIEGPLPLTGVRSLPWLSSK